MNNAKYKVEKKIRLDDLLNIDNRYAKKAYKFINKQLRLISKNHISNSINITVVFENILNEAIKKFGPIASMVFEYWGIYNTYDLTEIINNIMNIKSYKFKIIYNELSYDLILNDIFDKKFNWLKEEYYE